MIFNAANVINVVNAIRYMQEWLTAGTRFCFFCLSVLTHLRLASLLWDIGKQHSPRCDAAERGVPSVAILFAWRNFIEK